MKNILTGLMILTSTLSYGGEAKFTEYSQGNFYDLVLSTGTFLEAERELLPEQASLSYTLKKSDDGGFFLYDFTIHEDGAKPLNNNEQRPFSVAEYSTEATSAQLCGIHGGKFDKIVWSKETGVVEAKSFYHRPSFSHKSSYGVITAGLSLRYVDPADQFYSHIRVIDIKSIKCQNGKSSPSNH